MEAGLGDGGGAWGGGGAWRVGFGWEAGLGGVGGAAQPHLLGSVCCAHSLTPGTADTLWEQPQVSMSFLVLEAEAGVGSAGPVRLDGVMNGGLA